MAGSRSALPVALAVMAAGLLVAAYALPVPNDAYDVLFKAKDIEERIRQISLVSELGSSIDGIKLLLTQGRSLGTGLESQLDIPASHASGHGLQLLATAVQAYIALYPGIALLQPGLFNFWPADTNAWYHAAKTYKPGTVTDFAGGVLYSSAFVTLKDGPVLVTTPEFKADNFWTLNFYEVYGNVFHTAGSAYGDNKASAYLIVPPGWEGTADDPSYQVLRSPTVEAYLLGRSFVVGNATAIAEFNLGWTLQAPRTIPQVIRYAYPETSATLTDYDNADPLQFWRVVGEVYRRNGAPHIVDPLLRLLPSLGLWREYGWVQASVEPLALQALKAAPYYASRIITAKWLNVGSPSHNYWNAPWNLGAYGSDYVTNAAIQKFFIIVNKAQDALYYYLFVDADGEPLTSDHDYVLEFPSDPPVPALSFWSLVTARVGNRNTTATNLTAGVLPTWANLAPDAYRTPNGTWPFRVSATVPPASSTPAERGYNFVQAPQPGTPFYITLRLYAPLDLALRDDYVPPPVLRAVPREGGSSPAPAASSPGPSSSSPGVRRLRARRT